MSKNGFLKIYFPLQSDWLKELYPNCISRAKETKIAKGCKLVAAILGDHCTVGDKCKLTNVITLDHVKIEASCELTNVVISSNAQIGEGSVLKDCIVGPKYQVVPGSKIFLRKKKIFHLLKRF